MKKLFLLLSVILFCNLIFAQTKQPVNAGKDKIQMFQKQAALVKDSEFKAIVPALQNKEKHIYRKK